MLVQAHNTLTKLGKVPQLWWFPLSSEELTRTKEPVSDPHHITTACATWSIRSKYHSVRYQTKSKIQK